MNEENIRTALILGDEAVNKLKNAAVAVFGVGGVGSYTVEALARAGVGKLILTDSDTVARTNINRQLIALQSTVGRPKVSVAAERISDISPDCEVIQKQCFFDASTVDAYDFSEYDYIVDAIDSVKSKLLLVETALKYNVPIISCMGMGNKLHPEMIELADISKTSVCPLCRVMRTELRRRNIHHLKCVYSKEPAIKPNKSANSEPITDGKRQIPGSVSFVPSAAGLIMAGEVVRELIKQS